MKYNIKFIIYIVIVVLLASVIWIKYDHDRGEKLLNANVTVDEFKNFIDNNNIKKINFSCPVKNEDIVYLDDKYLLSQNGELYNVNFERIFNNEYNCQKINTSFTIAGFYNNNLVYDDNYNFYDLTDNLNPYLEDNIEYYIEDLNNLIIINKKYPYIYFYDMEAKYLALDSNIDSNKILIDSRGNINIYTNYGYPTSFNLLKDESTEIIFNRLDYMGVILAIYRSNNNQPLNIAKTRYLAVSEEVSKDIRGLRIITNRGMYNEVMDNSCIDSICDTKLVLDQEFSKYFNDIVYSNGKYVFISSTPTTIYNIEKYVSKSSN